MEALDSLNTPITATEFEVLKQLPSGKLLSPDGFTYLYYQTFRDRPLSYLTPLYNGFLEGQPIPHNMMHSYVTMIPKSNNDPLDCSNYRPIALLNSGLKIFPNILANRLLGFLT